MSPHHFHVERLRLFHPRFPRERNGFRALHITDIHMRADRRGEELVQFLSKGEYDLVLFGGDFQEGHGEISPARYRALAEILRAAHARHGVYTCLGNHDKPRLVAQLREEPIRIGENESYRIFDDLYLCVLADAWHHGDDPALTLKNVPAGAFRFGLAHSPDSAHAAAAAGFDILITGHTHGGQIVLPWLGTPYKRLKRDRRLLAGNFRIDRMILHVSDGFGMSLLPLRFRTRCMVTEVTMEHGPVWKNRFRRIRLERKWAGLKN